MPKRILIVDDEEDITSILKYNLQKAGYEAEAAASAEQASQLDLPSFDLLLLDVMMDGLSGFDFAKILKAQPETASLPIIFITAKDTVDDTVEGLELGADDYISKPFSLQELLSRVKAVLRRTGGEARPGKELISIDERAKTVTAGGATVVLTKIEYELLRLLYSSPGRVFSREEILQAVWPDDVIVTERTVDVNLTRLRKKLPSIAPRLVSRHGFGYFFDASE